MLSKLFKLEYPFFTVIATIFSMENSIANSLKAGVLRLLGTLIGALIGIIFISIKPGNAALMGIGTLVLISICNIFKLDRAVPIAGVVFASIMLSLDNKNPIEYSFSRVVDTFTGIVIAIIVDRLIFPPNTLDQMRKRLGDISVKISKAIAQFVCLGESVDLNSLQNEVVDLIKFLEIYKIEFKHKISTNTELSNIDIVLESLRNILSHLKTIYELGPECCINTDNIEKIKLLKPCVIINIKYSENNQNIIYNYHVSKALEILIQLSAITK